MRGTAILTPTGEKPVESLKRGDLVVTLGHGQKPIRKILRRVLKGPDLKDKHKPVEFKPGSLGPDLPRRPLAISPQHRILMPGSVGGIAQENCLVPAKALLHLSKVRQKRGCKSIEYFHLIFDQHEVVFSEGVATESFFPGPVALNAVGKQVNEIREIFNLTDPPVSARFPLVGVSEARRRFEHETTYPPGPHKIQ